MRWKYRILVFAFLLILLAATGLFSCSPGKRMLESQAAQNELYLRQKAHDEQVAAAAVAAFVKGNPCPAMPEINLDSLCGLFYDPLPTREPVNTAADYFEHKNPSVKDTANKTASGSPKRILVPFEDKRRINLLEDSCMAKDSRLSVAGATITLLEQQLADSSKNHLRAIRFNWALGILLVLMILAIIVMASRK